MYKALYMLRIILFSSILTLFPCFLKGQGTLLRHDSILVTEGNDTLNMAWAGGFNAVGVQNIDLDGQGGEDIIVLDHTGKLLALVKVDGPGGIKYQHRPGREQNFPPLKFWVIAKDFNCDGKKDLFTYGSGTIALYKNISTPGAPDFELVTNEIESFQQPNTFPIYSGSIDLPSITDVDNDGDLDILVFNIGGISVDYHKNQSMELYGHCDSLAYTLTTSCWGKFEEGVSSNNITLNACSKSLDPRHSGSTLLAFDEDGDNDKDLLLGDVNDSGLVFLRNGGTLQTAAMDTVHYLFPHYGSAAYIDRFVAPYIADINGDGKNDFLVSPFTVNSSANFQSLIYYENTGTTATNFSFVKKDLFQDEMLDFGEGSYPVFFDYDNNGTMDLVIGNYGYYSGLGNYDGQLALLKNKGTNLAPEYELITRDFAGLSSLDLHGIYPAFGDLDNDGDMDMIIGEDRGILHRFENVAGSSSPANFVLQQSNYGGVDVGNFSTPCLADINRDGKLDLVIGEANGTLNYIQNSGTTAAPQHLHANRVENFGNVSVANQGFTIGYSTPVVIEENNRWLILTGSENGRIHLFDNIENNLGGTFTELSSFYSNIWEGNRSSIAVFKPSSGVLHAAVGSYRGGISFYKGSGVVSVREVMSDNRTFIIYPNPSSESINIQSEIESGILQILDLTGRELYQGSYRKGASIDISGYKPGTYLVILSQGGNRQLGRFSVID